MSNVTTDIKKLFNFKYKARDDGITDQYNRHFMVKALLVAAFLTGMSWYKDDIKCIIPKTATGDSGDSLKAFAPQACWINGFYVYEQLRHTKNYKGYYGLPSDMSHNGSFVYEGVVETCTALPGSVSCKPMAKLFYLQFQWFPFFLAALGVLYYIPYTLFHMINADLFTLKKSIKSQKPDVDDVIKSYFNPDVNQPQRQNMRVFGNILVKISYLFANVLSFVFTDNLLNGDFRKFGSGWFDWSEKSNYDAYNYVGKRFFNKPGDILLPTFGFCDVSEAGQDIVKHLVNDHRFVCEFSQHVLYHYVLIALWIVIVIGMVMSIIGIVVLLAEYGLRSLMFANEETAAKRIYHDLSIREREYLSYVRKRNVPLYGLLIRKLYQLKYEGGEGGSKKGGTPSNEMEMNEKPSTKELQM